MSRTMFVLTGLLLASALSLVTARFQSRQLFITLDRLEGQARELNTEWRLLQLERAEQARQTHIDRTARETLGLIPRAPEHVLYIKPPVTEPTQR